MTLTKRESAVEQACRAYAKKVGFRLLKITGVAGWPDRLLLSPHGHHVFIEFKRPGESPRELQEYIIEMLNKELHGATWIDNLTSFKMLVAYISSLPQNGSPEYIKRVASNGC